MSGHSAATRQRMSEAQRKRRDEGRGYIRQPGPRIRLVCVACRMQFEVRPSEADHRYCSNKCRYAHKVGDNGANAGGGEHMRGDKNPRWRGGVSESGRGGPASPVGRWRRRVLAAAGFTCQRCGAADRESLVAHHVAPWATSPALRYDTSNGACLCRGCHTWVHSRANAAREWLA